MQLLLEQHRLQRNPEAIPNWNGDSEEVQAGDINNTKVLRTHYKRILLKIVAAQWIS